MGNISTKVLKWLPTLWRLMTEDDMDLKLIQQSLVRRYLDIIKLRVLKFVIVGLWNPLHSFSDWYNFTLEYRCEYSGMSFKITITNCNNDTVYKEVCTSSRWSTIDGKKSDAWTDLRIYYAYTHLDMEGATRYCSQPESSNRRYLSRHRALQLHQRCFGAHLENRWLIHSSVSLSNLILCWQARIKSLVTLVRPIENVHAHKE